WDSNRSKFWFLPGYQLFQTHDTCSPDGIYGAVMTYDPISGQWAVPTVDPNPFKVANINAQLPKNGVYDPATDSVWRAGAGVEGVVFQVLHLATGHWDTYPIPCATNLPNDGISIQGPCASGNAYINSTDLGFEQLAFDPV